MTKLEVTCPFCGAVNTVDHDGLYNPRYAFCDDCGEKFIWEPMAKHVAVFKPGEADCCSDPECRATEMCSHCEE